MTAPANINDPSLLFVIYNVKTSRRASWGGPYNEKTYYSVGVAKAVLSRRINSGKAKEGQYEVIDLKTFNEKIDVMVEVTNLMSGRPVMIRLSDAGGVCDPSTERYWTM